MRPPRLRARLTGPAAAALGALSASILAVGVAMPTTTAAYTDGEYAGGIDLTVGQVLLPDIEFTEIVAGYDHALALAKNGAVYAWGYNGYGQLGTGDTTTRTVPVKVAALAGKTITDIAAGANTSYFVDGSGTAYAVGEGDHGELAQGGTGNSTALVAIAVPEAVASLAAYRFTAGVVTTAGNVYTWGIAQYGVSGYGNDTNSTSPKKIAVSNVTQLAFGMFNGIALTTAGTVYTWGTNAEGELGANFTGAYSVLNLAVTTLAGVNIKTYQNPPDFYTVQPGLLAGVGVAVLPLSGVASVGAGYTAMGAIMDDGTVYTWGTQDSGELGNGTATAQGTTPVKIPTRIGAGIGNAASFIGTGYNNWGLITTAGQIYLWGYAQSTGGNGDGRAAGTVLYRPTASTVLTGGYRAAANMQPEGGSNSVLALSSDGTLVYGVGDQSNGDLGNGLSSGTAATTPAVWVKPDPMAQ